MTKQTQPPGLLRSAGIVSAAVATSRVTGLMRESVLSALFGASASLDAFILGYRIPNLARDLFADGALSAAFVPTFSRYLATKSKEEARELSNVVASLLMLVTGCICGLGMLVSPQFVELFASGFHAVPGKFELAVDLVRIMFPFLFLVALAAQAQGILNACHQFGVPAVSSSMFNIGSIATGLALGYWVGPRFGLSMVHCMAFGILAGGMAQLAFQLPAVWRAGFHWTPRVDFHHEGVRQILRLMGPAVIGGASVQVNVLVNTTFAAGLTDAAGHAMNGPVTWLNCAFRFMQLPIGVFGIALAQAALPRMARSAAEGDLPGMRATLLQSLNTMMMLTIPASVGLAVLGRSMIALVYQHGKFLARDTDQTALALACYAVGLASYASVRLLAPAFYALGDARTPMLVSMASVVINGCVSFATVRIFGWGHAGLALALSAVSIFNSVVLAALLGPRLGGTGLGGTGLGIFRGGELGLNCLKSLVASAVMGCACYGIVRLVPGAVASLVLGIPVGAAVYYVTASALGIPELARVRETVLRRFGGN